MANRNRAYWKGYLRLSLVTIAVEIYNAVESKNEISFRQIHKPSGKRVHYAKVVEGIGNVDNADIVKGFEVDDDTYVALEPEEIEAVKLESKKTIDLVQFVDARDIDYRYYERPYFITPADSLAGEGYVVIRDALAKTGRVGLAQVTIGGREWLVAVANMGDGLVMETLRYADELRAAPDFLAEMPKTKPQKDMVDLAVQLIEQKSAPFRPEVYRDHYRDALKQLVQQKMRGRKIVAADDKPSRAGANVIDLMEALKRSIGQSSRAAKKPAANQTAPTTSSKAVTKRRKSS